MTNETSSPSFFSFSSSSSTTGNSDTPTTGSGSQLPFSVLFTCTLFALFSTILSLWTVWLQLKNYRKVLLQRGVVRILVMVPIYSLSSLISLYSLSMAFYLDAIRDIYEAFVIYCFFTLLVEYLGGERSLLTTLHGRSPVSHPWPMSLWLPPMDLSDPYTFLGVKRGVLQYVQIKPILAIVTMISKATGTYKDGSLSTDAGYTYVSVVYNISVCLSLYCLGMFWACTHDDLRPFRPVPKFLCVKGIIFFSFWQGFFISILVATGLITSERYSSETLGLAATDALMCFEMPLFAFLHLYAFSHKDYIPTKSLYSGRLPFSYALKDSLLGYKDVVTDSMETLKGRGFSYRTFEPAEGGVHQGLGRERRVRAGLRYTEGGKGKYWMPMPGSHASEAHGRRNANPITKSFSRPRVAMRNVFDKHHRNKEGYSILTPEQAVDVVHRDPEWVAGGGGLGDVDYVPRGDEAEEEGDVGWSSSEGEGDGGEGSQTRTKEQEKLQERRKRRKSKNDTYNNKPVKWSGLTSDVLGELDYDWRDRIKGEVGVGLGSDEEGGDGEGRGRHGYGTMGEKKAADDDSLGFEDPADEEDEVYRDSRKLEFGDYNYPCVDASKEEARRRMREDEERALYGKPIGSFPMPQQPFSPEWLRERIDRPKHSSRRKGKGRERTISTRSEAVKKASLRYGDLADLESEDERQKGGRRKRKGQRMVVPRPPSREGVNGQSRSRAPNGVDGSPGPSSGSTPPEDAAKYIVGDGSDVEDVTSDARSRDGDYDDEGLSQSGHTTASSKRLPEDCVDILVEDKAAEDEEMIKERMKGEPAFTKKKIFVRKYQLDDDQIDVARLRRSLDMDRDGRGPSSTSLPSKSRSRRTSSKGGGGPSTSLSPTSPPQHPTSSPFSGDIRTRTKSQDIDPRPRPSSSVLAPVTSPEERPTADQVVINAATKSPLSEGTNAAMEGPTREVDPPDWIKENPITSPPGRHRMDLSEQPEEEREDVVAMGDEPGLKREPSEGSNPWR